MAFGTKNRKKIIEHIANLDNFVVGNMRGAWYPTPQGVTLGKLTDSAKAHGWEDLDPGQPVYVVYSYETPIAWRTAGGRWVHPGIVWSVITSHHQSLAKQGAKGWDDKCNEATAHL